jgi:hypothetical protein
MTSENPYRSPGSPNLQPWPTDATADGLWRDGTLLVMRNQNPVFPRRCIKTNMPYTGPPTRLKLTWLENETLWVLLVGAIGRAAVMATDGKKIWVDVPISETWLARRRRSAIIGWGLTLGGIGSFVLAVVGYVAAMASGMSEESVLWLMFFILGGPLAALVGVFWLVIFQQAPVKAKEITNGLAWIQGTHPDFLASLPEWPWRESVG